MINKTDSDTDKSIKGRKIKVDPRIYGLPSRTALFQTGADSFVIVINRKSRIIMKDAKNIFQKTSKIQQKEKNAVVFLETTAPICSKSLKFLNENGIRIAGGDQDNVV